MSGFFDSEHWARVLAKGFGVAQRHHECAGQAPIRISIFRKAGLGIAIPAMPLSLPLPVLSLFDEGSTLCARLRADGVAMLRVNIRSDSESEDLRELLLRKNDHTAWHIQSLPTTAISELQGWHMQCTSASARRNVRRALREGVETDTVQSVGFAQFYEDLYRQTVERHHGKVRYTSAYFSALDAVMPHSRDIRAHVAYNADRIAIAFMIVADHGNDAVYLHGASDRRYGQLRAMDLLFHTAIEQAQRRKMHRFDMLASPSDQSELVRYKEKWGGQTQRALTCTRAFNPCLNGGIHLLARWQNRRRPANPGR